MTARVNSAKSVIPANAGIQKNASQQTLLDPRVRGDDGRVTPDFAPPASDTVTRHPHASESGYAKPVAASGSELTSQQRAAVSTMFKNTLLGAGAASFAHASGAAAYVHESLGHGVLGFGLTAHYPRGFRNIFQVDLLDNLKSLAEASTFKEHLTAIGHTLSGFDANGDGAGGMAFDPGWGPNDAGKFLGESGRSAWASLSGSVPDLAINSLAILGGLEIRQKHPALGYALISYGAMSHAIASVYPLQALWQLDDPNALAGHDFVGFAKDMSAITGLSPTAMAWMTAGAYIGLVPAVVIAMRKFAKNRRTTMVPDATAVQHWLSHSNEDPSIDARFVEMLHTYPDRRALQDATRAYAAARAESGKNPDRVARSAVKRSKKCFDTQRDKFDGYIATQLGRELLLQEKRDLLGKWEALQGSDALASGLNALGVAGLALHTLVPVANLLARNVLPALSVVGKVGARFLPWFRGFVVAAIAYDAFRDLRSPTSVVPPKAKALSALRAMTACGTLAASGLVAAGVIGPAIFPALVGLAVADIWLASAKGKIVRRQFLKTHAPKAGDD